MSADDMQAIGLVTLAVSNLLTYGVLMGVRAQLHAHMKDNKKEDRLC